MKKTHILLAMVFSLILGNSCSEENILEDNVFDYITFAQTSYSAVVDLGGDITVDVSVLTSKKSSSDRSIGVSVDGSTSAGAGSYSVPETVIIPAGSQEGTLTVTLSDSNLGIGVNNLVLSFTDEEGAFVGGTTTVAYTQQCNEVTAVLDFVFDGFASETTWEVKDALDNVVVSGGGTYSDGQATASEDIVLCAGRDYTLIINDSFGDGLSFPTNGTYTLTLNGVVKAQGGGNFGNSDSSEFDTK
ncbi:hypothetical protein [Seonamhaeicola sp. ML3]|uniref:hypothetical protein n=1 Tax=Seonamhaeicola sp. ML3 TaxID=2937786 RepID=UPI00200E14BC|nr:hypothetical protein [Seonamhaeicola sp. ML3]